ncbi:heterokaryon incompatibility protein-domain-containing protein [Rhexocercosporidium sp. MPI-PUGE-AT-0058]|nr:heterokaryon incompatibility protein-domain-containing protein [Rhexocercosporidium sp. MPI-PUGE-AT-0058]
MICRWIPAENAFDYGFRKRCHICRTSLEPVDPEVALPTTARGVIVPSETACLFMQSKNCEEDLLQILQLRGSLTSHDQMAFEKRLTLPTYWLLRCLKSHKQCNPNQGEAFLTKRLIVLDKLNLIETHPNQRVSYCTLSYRWMEFAVVLRQDNLSNFQHAIPAKELSQTIQHAMAVARDLGFKYMWVDALCIVQDMAEDWQDQAAEMDKIYHFSSLTIAMVDSDKDWQRDYHRFRPKSKADRKQNLWRPGGELDTRGWTLQESVLPRRTLSIMRSGIYWTCTRWNCSENYPAGIPDDKEWRWREATVKSTTNMRSNIHEVNFPDLQGWATQSAQSISGYELWHRLVEDYTCRDLTVLSDKLTAIEGIAKFLAPFLDNDKCFAGVWRRNFQQDLLWISKGYKGIVDPASLAVLNAFPSWSWGSVGRTVEYMQKEYPSHWAVIELLDIKLEKHDRVQYFGQIVLKGILIPNHTPEDRRFKVASAL